MRGIEDIVQDYANEDFDIGFLTQLETTPGLFDFVHSLDEKITLENDAEENLAALLVILSHLKEYGYGRYVIQTVFKETLTYLLNEGWRKIPCVDIRHLATMHQECEELGYTKEDFDGIIALYLRNTGNPNLHGIPENEVLTKSFKQIKRRWKLDWTKKQYIQDFKQAIKEDGLKNFSELPYICYKFLDKEEFLKKEAELHGLNEPAYRQLSDAFGHFTQYFLRAYAYLFKNGFTDEDIVGLCTFESQMSGKRIPPHMIEQTMEICDAICLYKMDGMNSHLLVREAKRQMMEFNTFMKSYSMLAKKTDMDFANVLLLWNPELHWNFLEPFEKIYSVPVLKGEFVQAVIEYGGKHGESRYKDDYHNRRNRFLKACETIYLGHKGGSAIRKDIILTLFDFAANSNMNQILEVGNIHSVLRLAGYDTSPLPKE